MSNEVQTLNASIEKKLKENSTPMVINVNDESGKVFKLPTVEVEQGRYDELIAAKLELRLLKSALSNLKGYCDIDTVKKIFNIEGDKNE